jgi:predicted AAA+ superfamily ATPase
MVFVGGPRQVGKTTFALTYLPEPGEKHPAYLNWDNISIRSQLLKGELPPNEKIIDFDEIHKFARWRNLAKDFYDTKKSEISFLCFLCFFAAISKLTFKFIHTKIHIVLSLYLCVLRFLGS